MRKISREIVKQLINEGALDDTWKMVDSMKEMFGVESLLDQIIKASSDDETKANLRFIARMNDLVWVEEMEQYMDRDTYENEDEDDY